MPSPVRLPPHQGFVSPLHSAPRFLLSFEPYVPSWSHSPLVGFNRVEDNTFLGVLHETIKEIKRKELALKAFRSPPPVDTKDVEVSP